MPVKEEYYFRFGRHLIPFIRIKESHGGSQYVIFPMDKRGFRISVHPFSNPHLKDDAGCILRLDLEALRKVDWEKEGESFQAILDSLYYWPSHRADLIAIPGPPGLTWVEGFERLFRDKELDLLAYLKAVLGYGVMYKVGYRHRKAFFETDLGRGCLIADPRERKFGFYAGICPERPLFGIRWDAGAVPFLMPLPLKRWKETLDNRMELAVEGYFSDHLIDMETALLESSPELIAFVENFRIVRWQPSSEHKHRNLETHRSEISFPCAADSPSSSTLSSSTGSPCTPGGRRSSPGTTSPRPRRSRPSSTTAAERSS